MKSSLTIRNADVVLPGNVKRTDVSVINGVINAIGSEIPEVGEVIDAEGLFLIPGIIDPQVHFREPGADHKEDLHSGSCAAAAGGVTSFLDMPNNNPPVTTIKLMAEKKQLAAEKSVVNYGFFIGATPDNLEELNAVENVCGIKIFMGASTGDLLVDDPDILEIIFANGKKLIAVHAEDESILQENRKLMKGINDVRVHSRVRDESAALSATKLAVRLSLKYLRRLHILHLTTEEECDFLRTLPREHHISTEVCPQHLVLTSPECYEHLGTKAQMNPPIRSKRHTVALWQALKDGIIDCIATDHAPHTLSEKNQPYGRSPSGMPGVETSLPLMLDRVNKDLCTLPEVVYWMSESPAKLYKMHGKGRIEVGQDADLALIDMSLKKKIINGELHTRVNWSPFDGVELQGWTVRTIVNGQTVFLNGEVNKSVRGKEIFFAS